MMRLKVTRRLNRLLVHHGRMETPRLVIVCEEVDAYGHRLDSAAQETVTEARLGVTFVYRASPTVVVNGERPDGPQ